MMFRLPTTQERLTINGRTGSGKTVFGAWVLSEAPFHRQPYVIIDYKGDELLTGIARAEEIGFSDRVPRHPGLYIMHPTPIDGDALEAWFWRVWQRERTGLFVDEAYMLPYRSKSFSTILTTGRALHIPVIALTQRPLKVSPFVYSEANYYSCFFLNDRRDQKTVGEFTPPDDPIWDMERRLEPYHSRWYDVATDFTAVVRPAPSPEKILERFDERLRPRKKRL